jgi:mRNA interferase RelE/StbE
LNEGELFIAVVAVVARLITASANIIEGRFAAKVMGLRLSWPSLRDTYLRELLVDVELTHRAVRDLDSLRRRHRPLSIKLLDKLESLAEDPLAGKPLTGPLKGLRSLRIGDWRVVYEVRKNSVVVLTVNNRKDIYR